MSAKDKWPCLPREDAAIFLASLAGLTPLFYRARRVGADLFEKVTDSPTLGHPSFDVHSQESFKAQ